MGRGGRNGKRMGTWEQLSKPLRHRQQSVGHPRAFLCFGLNLGLLWGNVDGG